MFPISAVVQRGRRLSNWLANPTTVQQRNIRNVLIDGFGVGLVTGVATFLSVFLVRLGATPFMVSLLTAMPALTGVILAIPIGRFIERQRNVVPWYSRSRIWVFTSYALTGVVPFIFPVEVAPIAIIAIWALATVPQAIVNITFTVVMGAVAGPTQRYYLMSRRWSIIGITTAVVVALVGAFLEILPFPLNYQVVFIASFGGGLLSYAFSNRISIPDNEVQQAASKPHRPWRARMSEALHAFRANAIFSRFVISAFVFHAGINLALPLFPLYWVREINASDFVIGLINTVNNGVVIIAYFFWSVMTRRYGPGLVLRICSLGLVFYPLLTGLTSTAEPLVLYAGIAGIFGAGLNLVLFDLLLSTCPKEHTASYVAVYQMTSYIAALIAPIMGTALADMLGFSNALFASAGLRFAGFLLFTLLGIGGAALAAQKPVTRPVPPTPPPSTPPAEPVQVTSHPTAASDQDAPEKPGVSDS